MAASSISSGALVMLEELNPSSPYFKQGASIRVTGNIVKIWQDDYPYAPVRLQEFNVEVAVAVLVDGSATLKVDTQHLNLNLHMSSIYQFIGELQIDASNEAILKARVGRNVDGMDLNLYRQSLQLLRDFQADQNSSLTA